jgi:hypothetical protein
MTGAYAIVPKRDSPVIKHRVCQSIKFIYLQAVALITINTDGGSVRFPDVEEARSNAFVRLACGGLKMETPGLEDRAFVGMGA